MNELLITFPDAETRREFLSKVDHHSPGKTFEEHFWGWKDGKPPVKPTTGGVRS